MLTVLVANGTHDEVDPDRRKAEGAGEGRAAAEVVLRGAVQVFEGKMRLQDCKIRAGCTAKWKGSTGGGKCETPRFDGNRWCPHGGARADVRARRGPAGLGQVQCGTPCCATGRARERWRSS